MDAEKSGAYAWGYQLAPHEVCAIESPEAATRVQAFLALLYEKAARSAAGAFYNLGVKTPGQAKEMGLEAAGRLSTVLSQKVIRACGLANYLSGIVATMMGENSRLIIKVARNEADARRLAQAPSPPPSEDSNRYPWPIRLALEAIRSAGLSARDEDIFFTVVERWHDDRSDVYKDLAAKYTMNPSRVRGVFCEARTKIEKRLLALLATYPQDRRDQFYRTVGMQAEGENQPREEG